MRGGVCGGGERGRVSSAQPCGCTLDAAAAPSAHQRSPRLAHNLSAGHVQQVVSHVHAKGHRVTQLREPRRRACSTGRGGVCVCGRVGGWVCGWGGWRHERAGRASGAWPQASAAAHDARTHALVVLPSHPRPDHNTWRAPGSVAARSPAADRCGRRAAHTRMGGWGVCVCGGGRLCERERAYQQRRQQQLPTGAAAAAAANRSSSSSSSSQQEQQQQKLPTGAAATASSAGQGGASAGGGGGVVRRLTWWMVVMTERPAHARSRSTCSRLRAVVESSPEVGSSWEGGGGGGRCWGEGQSQGFGGGRRAPSEGASSACTRPFPPCPPCRPRPPLPPLSPAAAPRG